jgi:hypothetical protein
MDRESRVVESKLGRLVFDEIKAFARRKVRISWNFKHKTSAAYKAISTIPPCNNRIPELSLLFFSATNAKKD